MGKIIINNILRYPVFIVLQVFFFKNIGYYNLAAPFPYVLFLLLLPIGISNLPLYLIGLFTGITIDIFYDTLGIHATACIVLCAFRIFFHNITLDRKFDKSFITPTLSVMGFKWFASYAFLGVFIHHLFLFFLEVFSFQNISITLLSTLMSSIFTFSLILLISLFFYKKKSRILE
ncbi:MAG TPA: hypothetical protein VK102_06950 [Sphingobacterium sp.]|nr:hypothetical protein [Sphingobacterium sp.]